MKKKRRHILWLYAVALLGVWCLPGLPTTAQEEIEIVVNPSNSISSVSPGDLHRILIGDKSTWPNGKHIFLVMAAPGSPEREVILKSVYKMSEADYAKYFLQAAFTGAVSSPPKDAASAADVKRLVAANAGAIGYLRQQDVDSSVKVLTKIP